MTHLLAMSFDVPTSPSITLRREGRRPRTPLAAGWGFVWYPGSDYAAAVVRDPRPVHDAGVTEVLRDWDRFRGAVFLCHIRGAARRPTEQDTHPFVRPYAGRDFVFAHNGQLEPARSRALPLGEPPVFEPVGTTDSEHAFCWLLTRMRDNGLRSLTDVGVERLHDWLRELNDLGTGNFLLSDGLDLVAYADRSGFRPLHYVRRRPPYASTRLENSAVIFDHSDPLDQNRTMVLVASEALDSGWSTLLPGEMMVIRRAAVTHLSSGAVATRVTEVTKPPQETWVESPNSPGQKSAVEIFSSVRPQHATNSSANDSASDSSGAGRRRLEVVHETTYTYEKPVERSAHTYRLQPVQNVDQQLLEHSLEISVDCEEEPYEDVFGNQALKVTIARSYTELRIVARSVVELACAPIPAPTLRTTIPLVWMPWQRQMMTPYLLPPEIPETQLRELSAFGMSFAERQDFDVLETLRDINTTIRSDFKYVSGATNIETTAFDVYVNRRGVCQDFANLFICLARLLGVPARYRVGYIYTGANYENTRQSEASHAWVEVYLPWVGWRGFDPTNGCLAGLDHVQVAAGRNYRDATPTSGTLYKGGAGEKLSVNVTVRDVTPRPNA